MRTHRVILLAVLSLVVVTSAGRNAVAGCEKDTDCKGKRICVKGECVFESELQTESTTTPGSTPPAPTEFQIHIITTDPLHADVSNIGALGWKHTPHYYTVQKPGEYKFELKKHGYEDLEIPVTVTDTDMTVTVQMNRPVFKAGLAFTILGAIGTIIAIAFACTTEGQDNPVLIAAPLGPGLALLLPGVGMLIGDRDEKTDTVVTVAPGRPE
jgi:hypothetical protein